MRVFPAVPAALILLSAFSAGAEVRGIGFDAPASDVLTAIVSGDSLKLIYSLQDNDQSELYAGQLEATIGGGRVKGRVNAANVPQGAKIICFRFVDKSLDISLAIIEPCDVFSAAEVAEQNQFFALRGLDTSKNYFSNRLNEIEKDVDSFSSTEAVLRKRENDFISLLKRPFDSDHYRGIGVLTAKLLARSAPLGRLQHQHYFQIHNPDAQGIASKIRTVVLGDTSTEGGTNAAKEILLGMQKISLSQYAFGQPEFRRNYWSTLRFLYQQRTKYVRDKNRNAGFIAKDFINYCSQITVEYDRNECLSQFFASYDFLVKADDTYNTKPHSDIMVTYQTVVQTTKCDPTTSGLSSEAFDEHLTKICGSNTRRCSRHFADMYRCFKKRSSE
ncbi:hypothetical protein NNA36_06540 [Shimia sp. CNT1-13L.2]|uniref:hypothetical protein n=1 Tax=Shimia sp. CNT1-13L.2 TaxID=2959663 RepID=UPI0020CE3993|nr:hypothetical protein [Shimia sp. CNT1-13L.2]MCP9481618.1 hypothetical protein [Shimia sp. CNT1-13L.2]